MKYIVNKMYIANKVYYDRGCCGFRILNDLKTLFHFVENFDD